MTDFPSFSHNLTRNASWAVPVAKQQLIRIADFDDDNVPVLGLVPETGQPREHIQVTTTTNVDAPVPDVMANPCTGISL